MKIEETKRRAAERLWQLVANNPPPTIGVATCEEYYGWLVDRLVENPDFQALAIATAYEMAKGEARKRKLGGTS